MNQTRLTLVLAVVTTVAWTASQGSQIADAAGPDPKRRVAVLEFRQGSPELPEIALRLANQLEKSTSLQIVDGNAARKKYGERLDRDLVRCRGAAKCVARIGLKLRVAEVLLVGVSEFGDVILTLQRIRVHRSKVETRIAEALEPGNPVDSEQLRGYLHRLMPKSDFVRYGVIRIGSNVDGAKVEIGNKLRGFTPIAPLRVPAPANYRIKVSKPGFITFRARVRVPPDGGVDVRTVLAARGSGDTWYKQWWVAAIAGTVVVGAATAVVLLTRDDPTEVDVVIPPFGGLRF